jgi:hypothetical protein
MPKLKKRTSWSSADVKTLRNGARSKLPAGAIAKRLKRTPGATRQKAFALGLSLETRKKVHYTRRKQSIAIRRKQSVATRRRAATSHKLGIAA